MNGAPRNPALHCAELVATALYRGCQVPPWLIAHIEECRSNPVSAAGHQIDSASEQLTHELIDAAQAGELLGLSERQVRRRHADWDGRLVAGRYLFNRRTVLDYVQWQRADAG